MHSTDIIVTAFEYYLAENNLEYKFTPDTFSISKEKDILLLLDFDYNILEWTISIASDHVRSSLKDVDTDNIEDYIIRITRILATTPEFI